MKNKWKHIKTVVLLATLPLVATAAASAHTWLADNDPIAIDMDHVVSANDQISSARVHQVALNSMGAIEGRIATIDQETKQSTGLKDLKVYFVKDGEIAKEATTNNEGIFVVEGMAEGAYSFVATGKEGFAAYGVRVVGNDGTETINVMEAAAVSPRFASVKKILEEKLPGEVAQQILATNDENASRTMVGGNRVRLNDGQLTGHVVSIIGNVDSVKGTYVHILRDDQPIAEVQANEQGQFEVNDLEPGVYDFVATGPTGFAAVSFEAVQDEAGSVAELIVQSDTEELPVSAEPVIDTAATVEPMPYVEADTISYQDAIPTDIPFDSGYGMVDSGYGMVDGGYGAYDSLDVCLTCGDTGFVGDQLGYAGTEYYADPISYDSGAIYDAPIEYAGEAIGYGCASGGACGACGDFSGYSSCGGCNTGGGLFGGAGGGGGLFGGAGYGGGGRLSRLALIGGLALGVVALTDDPSDPASQSPNN